LEDDKEAIKGGSESVAGKRPEIVHGWPPPLSLELFLLLC
jgi:hypothetical protein